mgnify:CR=1 FL=1
MQQLLNITDLRNNLSQIVSQVAIDNRPVFIIRDSKPEAALISLRCFEEMETEQKKLWGARFDNLLSQGKISGDNWLKKKGLNRQKLNEDQLYNLVSAA